MAEQRILLKSFRCKFKSNDHTIDTKSNTYESSCISGSSDSHLYIFRSLLFDPIKCKIVQGENNKELTTLDWDSVAALKFIARPFGSASIFLEISRTSKTGP